MTASVYYSAINALWTAWPALLPAVDVHLGQPRANEERKGLFIGADETDADANGDQRWPGLGHVWRDDAIEIPCILWFKSGDEDDADILAGISTVSGYLDTLDTWLRANVTLGLAAGMNVRAQMQKYQWSPYRDPEGFTVRVKFTINVEARLS